MSEDIVCKTTSDCISKFGSNTCCGTGIATMVGDITVNVSSVCGNNS